jgi:hypothetical protein
VYALLVVEGLMLLTAAPGLLVLVLLDRDPSNLPLAAASAVPLGPAVSAALYALQRHRGDLADLAPAADFWRGYRLNAGPVLKLWVPWLAWLAVIAVGLAQFRATGLPGWWAALLVAVGVAAALWGLNALVITSLFAFRARDVARLSAYFLGRCPGVALGGAGLLAAAAGVVLLSSEAVLALLGSIFAGALLRTSLPMTTRVREEFTG